MMSSSNNPKSRIRRDTRPDNPRRMYETENDIRIVRLVYEYRLLSQNQLQRLLGKSRSTVQQFLVRLYHHHYLERVFLPVGVFGSSPTLYILDKRGVELLMRQGIENITALPGKDLKSTFLEHTLAMNEFRIHIQQGCDALGWRIPIWQTENEIKADYDKVKVRGLTKPVPLIPDSYFVVEIPNRGRSHFFLELDRGTMTTKRFKDKIAVYVGYYKGGGFNRRYNAQGFRVLTVVDTPGTGRSNNLAEVTGEVDGIGRRFWFTSLSLLSPETVLTHPVWRIAGELEPKSLFTT